MRKTQWDIDVDEHVRIQDEQTNGITANIADDYIVYNNMRDSRSNPPRGDNNEKKNLVYLLDFTITVYPTHDVYQHSSEMTLIYCQIIRPIYVQGDINLQLRMDCQHFSQMIVSYIHQFHHGFCPEQH